MTDLPIACELSPEDFAQRRSTLLPSLLAGAHAREPVPGGFRWRFAASAEVLAAIAAVIDAERQCCRFLQFRLTVEQDGGPVWLELTGPSGTEAFLVSLLGPAEDGPAAA